jgi:hypothetical protein
LALVLLSSYTYDGWKLKGNVLLTVSVLFPLLFWGTQKTDLKEPHVCIKFWFKLGKNTTETYIMLKVAFGSRYWEDHKFCVDYEAQKWCDLC